MIEIMTFRLKGDVDEPAFLEADESFRTSFLYLQPGLRRATTARADDGEWVLVLLWSGAEAAEAASHAAQADPVAQAFLDLVDRDSATRRRYTLLD